MASRRSMMAKEAVKEFPNSLLPTQSIHFISRQAASLRRTPPAPELTDEEKAALITEYQEAEKDAADADAVSRMMGSATKGLRQALEREQEAILALQYAGIPIPTPKQKPETPER
jgi:hypothetical protein